MPVIGPNEKFTRYDDGSVVFPNGGGYDPEERRNISPRELAQRRLLAQGKMAHSPQISALIRAIAKSPGTGGIEVRGSMPGPPQPNVMDFGAGGYEFAHPLQQLLQNILLSQAQSRNIPVQMFPPNSGLGRLQRAYGVK